MGGDHHHPKKVVIPDYRIYKVEDCPELMRVQRLLAQKGLKDPWLRNEVWKYLPTDAEPVKVKLHRTYGVGIKYGVIAFAITTALETLYDLMKSPVEHSHDQAHH